MKKILIAVCVLTLTLMARAAIQFSDTNSPNFLTGTILIQSTTNILGSTNTAVAYMTNNAWNFTLAPGTYNYNFSLQTTNVVTSGALIYMDLVGSDTDGGFWARGDQQGAPAVFSTPNNVHIIQLITTSASGGYSFGAGVLVVTGNNLYRPQFEAVASGSASPPSLLSSSYIIFRRIK
jgi:hypothetical protein